MTIKELLTGRSTLDQLEILMRADAHVLLRNQFGMRVGRYYGGHLSSFEEKMLTLERKERHGQTPQS